MSGPRTVQQEKGHVLITGGAGFIGTNLADRLLSCGKSVLIFDDLSRNGSVNNLGWLQKKHGARLAFEQSDVRHFQRLRTAVRGASAIFHFAAQVAVTDSLMQPRHDFDVNAGGTLNLLEAVRGLAQPPTLLFTSTNKVYGALEDLNVRADGRRYSPDCGEISENGIGERRNLDFHSPYGCSKGAADQYILDYARTFHLPAVVFRMSCIYGTHQNGTEDQGWVAHFLICANQGRPLRIYGDGKQVRDVLFITDLLDAFELAVANIARTTGKAFNIGGGTTNSISLLELLELMEELNLHPRRVTFDEWRTADQRYYISDIRRFASLTGWAPSVGVREGLKHLQHWLVNGTELSESNALEKTSIAALS